MWWIGGNYSGPGWRGWWEEIGIRIAGVRVEIEWRGMG